MFPKTEIPDADLISESKYHVSITDSVHCIIDEFMDVILEPTMQPCDEILLVYSFICYHK